MAVMQTVTCNACSIRNERMEMRMVATFAGAAAQTYTFNVSHKKHAISSYKTNSAPPPAAPVNTLVNMSENEFRIAFSAYGQQLALKMVGMDSGTFNPSAPNNRIVTGQIAFSSDAAHLGGNVHCFPFNMGPSQTPRAISVSTTAFNDFKTVTQFLFRTGQAPVAGARAAWGRIENLVRGRVGQANELLSATEIVTLTIRLQGGVDALVRGEMGEQRRVLNASDRLDNQGRPPFRSRG